jgi:hypothetical protein
MKRVRLNSQIRTALLTIFEQSGALAFSLELKKRGGSVSICAGAVRDAIAAYEDGIPHVEPRDIDIGIGSVSRSEFDGIMREFGASPNRYGGYKIAGGKCDLEFWRLQDTVGLKKTHASCTLQNVLRSFVLNCNAISFDPFSEACIDGGARDAIRAKHLDFVNNAIIHSEDLFASKAVILCLRHGFAASAAIQSFVIRNWTESCLRHELKKVFSEELESRIFRYYSDDRFNDEYRWFSKARISFMDILGSLQSVEKRNKVLEGSRSRRFDAENEQKKVHGRK